VKLVLFDAGAGPSWGLLTERGVVSLADSVIGDSPQAALEHLIDTFDAIRSRLELLPSASATPLERVRLLPPVPRPGKILCTTAVYGAGVEKRQLLLTLKSAESVIGPDDTVRLPATPGTQWEFVPQAALALVMRGPSKRLSDATWSSAVFGVTCGVDVMARGDEQLGRDFWLAKSDTLNPLGPCIVTLDELGDLEALRVRSWQNGEPAQSFTIAQASHSIAEQLELATTIMTLHTGDVVLCGTSPEGQRPLREGDRVEVEIDGVGRMSLSVAAPVAVAA